MRGWSFLLSSLIGLAGCSAGGAEGTPRGEPREEPDGGESSRIDAGPGLLDPCAEDGRCPTGSYCSAIDRCIPDGECRAEADCEGGLRCGEGSRQCLEEEACAADGDCSDGMACDLEVGRCGIGGECGTSEFEIERIRPNMMILLDRSGSMDAPLEGKTRWDVAKEAVESVTTRFDRDIRFGLSTYPSCEVRSCGAGKIVVPIADGNAAAINGFLDPLLGRPTSPPVSGAPTDYLCGQDGDPPQTSTGRSLFALVGEASLQDPMRGNYVLLVTDGAEKDECTDDGARNGRKGARELRRQDPSVLTYVVGFTRDVDTGELDRVAAAGGTERHYAADDGGALLTALETIVADIVSCEYTLDSAPPNPDELYVFFDDDPDGVGRDTGDGWTYDPPSGTLRFEGMACEQLLAGEVTDIDVVFGCPEPVLE